MTIYAVYVEGYNYVMESVTNEFIKAFDTKEKAEIFVNSESKKVKYIQEELDKQLYACSVCDLEDGCEHCDWNKWIDRNLHYTSVKGLEILIDCDILHGDNPEFVIREIEVS